MNKVQRGILIDRCIERYCKKCKNNGISCKEERRREIRDKSNELELNNENIEKNFNDCQRI
jgi:hypothetical protein